MIRKLSSALAVLAVGAAGGVIGQSLAANASERRASLTDKVFYAKTNPAFETSVTTATDTAKTVLTVTVDAPSAGQVDIVINTSMWTDFPASSTTTLFGSQEFARCSAADSLDTGGTAKCANETNYYFQKPPNTTSSDITEPYSLQAQLNFAAAGERSLFLNASSSGYVGGLYSSAHIQVAFTPTNPIANNSTVTVSATT